MTSRNFYSYFAVLVVCWTPMAAAQQQQPESQSQPLPSSDVIIANYIAANGGEMAFHGLYSMVQKARSRYSTGNREEYEIETVCQGDRWRIRFDKVGSDEYWMVGLDQGKIWKRWRDGRLEFLSGQSRDEYLNKKFLSRVLDWLDYDDEINVQARESIDGRDVYRVHFVSKQGIETTQYFDVNSHIIYRTDWLLTGHPIETVYSDMRSIGGIQFAFKQDSKYRDRDIAYEIIVEDIVLNQDIEPSRLDMPAELKKNLEDEID